MDRIYQFSVEHPKVIAAIMLILTFGIGLLAAVPTLWPGTFSFLHPAEVDTDPENMLQHDEPVRVFHDEMRKTFALYDMVVLGVVNESHPEGVFNIESLNRIYQLTEYAKTLRWDDPESPRGYKGVIEVDLIAPSTVDNVEQGGPGEVKFEWLMPAPPKTEEEALAVRAKAKRLPFLNGTVLSDDGKALAIYIPITSKDLSYRVAKALKEKADQLGGDDGIHITGLPVAEDQFGVEMFIQMAISAPLAMLVIFLLMLVFFRKIILILSPMIVAIVSVIMTMGLLVVTGNTIHIMSSMIPIFIMPIAVLDAIHILSDFFDHYQDTRDRKKTILHVMRTLGSPMLFTSLTTMAGFASLALTPIPPVQIFGLFVAFGVAMAWIWTVTFIPAYVMFIRQESLENFGFKKETKGAKAGTMLSRLLDRMGSYTYRHAKGVMAVTLILVAISIYGISRIRINDNPIKWFHKSHPIRVADRVLNEHFGGTYMAYLAFEPEIKELTPEAYLPELTERLEAKSESLSAGMPEAVPVFAQVKSEAARLAKEATSEKAFLAALKTYADDRAWNAPDEYLDAWDEAIVSLDLESMRDQVFKEPEVLNYVASLQDFLLTTGVVGKSNSLPDIVKTVYRELMGGEPEYFQIPDSPSGVAQVLLTYQSSHRPDDLWHFVTPDFKTMSMWVQLKSGDNTDMAKVVEALGQYMIQNPPPVPMQPKWFGLTYINVIWQDKMVSGMLQSFLGSFLVVLLMMTLLFRSALWGLLSMIPLTVTILLIYGVIGLVGKDYDMPVAVLSSLSLGLAVDYAIHFLARSRSLREKYGDWASTIGPVFGEPARAIARNVVVIGVGFLPLLAAPLVPYQTVGFFIASILLAAGVASLFLLPALITLMEKLLFPKTHKVALICQCGTCVVSAIVAVAAVALNVHQFFEVGYTTLTWLSLAAVLVLMGLCRLSSRRRNCKVPDTE